MRVRTPAVYILASQRRGTMYIGVTSDPLGRWWQHREKQLRGFTSRYGVTWLVLVEFFGDMEHAILREKQLKRWHRDWKINLIEATNPTWRDLALDYGFEPLNPRRPSRVDAERGCHPSRVISRRYETLQAASSQTSQAGGQILPKLRRLADLD